jgi:endonuclease YncB( thermonuclease family)
MVVRRPAWMRHWPAGRQLAALLAALALVAGPGCAATRPAAAPAHVPASPLPSAGTAQRLHGRLQAIQDGDSFVLATGDGRQLRIRIAGIDAPERGQAWGGRAREHLNELLARHPLQVAPLKQDRYGRTIADVHNGAVDVGLAQIRAGLAWHYRRYADEQPPTRRNAYAQAERQAREQHQGLWQDSAPQAPWLLRAQQRRQQSAARISRQTP